MEKVTFAQLGLVVAIAILAINPVLSVISFFRTQKREVSVVTEFASKTDVHVVDAKVNVLDAKVEKLKSEIITNGEARKIAIEAKVEAARCEARACADDLREKVESVRTDVAELVGETRIINQNFAQLSMEVRNSAARSYPDGARRAGI